MNISSTPTRQKVLRLLEWVCSVFGAAVCLGVVLLFASQQPDNLWPLPGFYFIEIALFGLLGVASRGMDTNPASRGLGSSSLGSGEGAALFCYPGRLFYRTIFVPGNADFLAGGNCRRPAAEARSCHTHWPGDNCSSPSGHPDPRDPPALSPR